jgi:hypothetical protein
VSAGHFPWHETSQVRSRAREFPVRYSCDLGSFFKHNENLRCGPRSSRFVTCAKRAILPIMGHSNTAIRQLSTSRTGTVLAAGERKRRVHLYDLIRRERLITIDTILDFGGRRLAVSTNGDRVIAGAYHIDGIAAYSATDGTELWTRQDLKKVQHIRFGAGDTRVLCGFEEGPGQSLNASTGSSEQPMGDIRRAWESSFASVMFVQRNDDYAMIKGGSALKSIPKISFAVLGVCFSPSLVCITEAGGPVRAFDPATTAEVWRHTPPRGTHFLSLSYCDTNGDFVGLALEFETGKRSSIHRFAANSGAETMVSEVPSTTKAAFCLEGSQLVQSSGAVFDVGPGQQIGLLPFPAREQSDRAP